MSIFTCEKGCIFEKIEHDQAGEDSKYLICIFIETKYYILSFQVAKLCYLLKNQDRINSKISPLMRKPLMSTF